MAPGATISSTHRSDRNLKDVVVYRGTHAVPVSIDEMETPRHMLTLTQSDSQHLPFTTLPSKYVNGTEKFVFFLKNIFSKSFQTLGY